MDEIQIRLLNFQNKKLQDEIEERKKHETVIFERYRKWKAEAVERGEEIKKLKK